MRPSARLGQDGEELAAGHLSAAGMTVLARNWRCREGELDVVARDRDGTLVFCEVKTRSSSLFGEPGEAVGYVKARRIRHLALRWLDEHPGERGADIRFDVVSVVRRPGELAELVHLRGAF